MRKILLSAALLLVVKGFAQTTIEQNGYKTTVTNPLLANGTQPLRYEIATIGFNSYHWQPGGLIIVELLDYQWAVGYEKYVIENGYWQGAQSGTPRVKLVESHGIQHDAKVLLGTSYDLSTSYGGFVNKALPIYVDVRNWAWYKVRISYMQDNVTQVTTFNQIKINIAPSGSAIPDFATSTILDNDLTSSGKLIVTGDAIHYIEKGKVGIGTASPAEKLSVNGTVLAKKVRVSQTASDWPDYVFDSIYQLPSLESLSLFIKDNKHLPEMPSASAIEEKGHDLGEVQKLLLKKVEEMTLYILQLKQENADAKKRIEILEAALDKK